MRHIPYTLKASTVHARRLLLAELELRDYKPRLPAAVAVSVLLLASLWQASLSAACSMLKAPPAARPSARPPSPCCPGGHESCSSRCCAPCGAPSPGGSAA